MKKFFLNLVPSKTRVSTENSANTVQSNAWIDPNKKSFDTDAEAVIDGVEEGVSVDDTGKKFFGVKSYLNYFYVSPAKNKDDANIVTSNNDSSSSGGVWYLLPPPSSQRRAYRIAHAFCRFFMYIGFLLLLGGAAAIVYGYCWPSIQTTLQRLRGDADAGENTIEASLMHIAIDQDEEGNFYIPPERLAELLRDPMHQFKIIGFCAFAVGASIMALSLIVTSSSCLSAASNRLATAVFASGTDDNTPPIRIYPGAGTTSPPTRFHIVPTKRAPASRISPTSGPVPAVEEIMRVQTTGLKKSPSTPTPTADDLLFHSTKADDVQPLIAT